MEDKRLQGNDLRSFRRKVYSSLGKHTVEIMDREVKRLKQSRIPIVKVRWNSRRGPEYTWEREDQMQKKYPHLFANPFEPTPPVVMEWDIKNHLLLAPSYQSRGLKSCLRSQLGAGKGLSFWQSGEVKPRYVGHFKVLEGFGEVAYKLELPEDLVPESIIHFLYLIEKVFMPPRTITLWLDGLNLDDKLHFVEEPVEIVDREVKRLKQSRIPLVKVRWDSKRGPEFTFRDCSYSVMSDSDESGVTHTEISSPFEDLSDIGSPRADDHELLEPPYMLEDPYAEAALQAPPSPDYVPGPEEPEQAPPSPDYVPGPEHDDDEIVAEDQPYAEDASPIAQSPDYVPESDPEADPEEDGDEDPEEDPIDYPADGGDDGDDEMDLEEDEDDDMDIEADEEDEDDEMDVEIDEEAEEEHLAPAYPVVVALPATAPSAED
ncbi:hypothetical protein Tco_0246325 [Tanacetum coccineum]